MSAEDAGVRHLLKGLGVEDLRELQELVKRGRYCLPFESKQEASLVKATLDRRVQQGHDAIIVRSMLATMRDRIGL